MKVLVTGGAGFIGSNFIHFVLKEDRGVYIYNLDKLTYAADLDNLIGIDDARHEIHVEDICNYNYVKDIIRQVDAVVNFAAESHVDRSIENADTFIQTNVMGTNSLLKAVLKWNPSVKFLQVGTDEVYGPLDSNLWANEEFRLHPSSPYAASKASADLVALSYYHTHGLNVRVSRSTNNYGPRQHPEKLIPKFITNALEDKSLPIYDDGSQVRDWLWVEDNCRALWAILQNGAAGEVYNIGACVTPEITNFQFTKQLLSLMGKSEDLIEFKVGARPGHDQRYAVDNRKILELGWSPKIPFEQGLLETIRWYTNDEG